jgi:hypothetical protein
MPCFYYGNHKNFECTSGEEDFRDSFERIRKTIAPHRKPTTAVDSANIP